MKEKIRFTEIDLLRFIAALSVMLFHYTIRGHATEDNFSNIRFPAETLFLRYGYLGVDLFFLISGFVILMSATGKSPKNFLISRIVRLYPAFWVCCTLTFVIVHLFDHGHFKLSFLRYLVNMTMLNGFINIGNIDGVYWTLLYEIKFYILIFILIYTKQIRHIQYYLGIWLLVSIVLLKPFLKLDLIFIPDYSAYFIAGSIFYLIYKEGLTPYKLLILLASFALAYTNAIRVLYTKSGWYHLSYSIPEMTALLFAFYLVFFLISLNKTRYIRSNFYTFLGDLTYPMYLLHATIGFVIFNHFYQHVNCYVLLIIVSLLIILLAYLIHARIERKFTPLLKRFLEKRLEFISDSRNTGGGY